MNVPNAVTGKSPTQTAKLRELARRTEAVGCRLRRALDRGNVKQADKALADLATLNADLTKALR